MDSEDNGDLYVPSESDLLLLKPNCESENSNSSIHGLFSVEGTSNNLVLKDSIHLFNLGLTLCVFIMAFLEEYKKQEECCSCK